MIRLMNGKTTYDEALRSNGTYRLDPICISAETTEDIFGNYELNIEIELRGDVPPELYQLIDIDNIITVDDEEEQTDAKRVELFRIAEVTKSLETISIYARHITIADSLNIWINNEIVLNDKNGQEALNRLIDGVDNRDQCNLFFLSNLKGRKNAHSANYSNTNLFDAISTAKNCFLNIWGGEIQRRDRVIIINDKRGKDKTNSIIIKEGINLVGFESSSNIDDLSTVIYPIGYGGLKAPKVVSGELEKYSMEFPTIKKYDDVRVAEYKDDGTWTEGFETEDEAIKELQKRAREEFEKNKIDKINFEIDIDYIDLKRFEEYKDLQAVQNTDLGDYIKCEIDTYGINLPVRVVKRVYDVLRGVRVSNTISTIDKLRRPKSVQDEVQSGLGPIKDEINKVDKKVCGMLLGGYNYIVNSDRELVATGGEQAPPPLPPDVCENNIKNEMNYYLQVKSRNTNKIYIFNDDDHALQQSNRIFRIYRYAREYNGCMFVKTYQNGFTVNTSDFSYKELETNSERIWETIRYAQLPGVNITHKPKKVLKSSQVKNLRNTVSKEMKFNFIAPEDTKAYIKGQEVTISCEVETSADSEFKEIGVSFKYWEKGKEAENEWFNQRARVVHSEKRNGKYRVWATFRLP